MRPAREACLAASISQAVRLRLQRQPLTCEPAGLNAAAVLPAVLAAVPAAYLDESVGYPISVDRLVPVQGSWQAVGWFQVWHEPLMSLCGAAASR